MARFGLMAFGVTAFLATACKGSASPSPAELARAAASARAAAASSHPPEPAAPQPVLALRQFTAQAPSAVCSAAAIQACALDNVGGAEATDLVTVQRGKDTVLLGWAADPETGTVPPVVLMQLAPPKDEKAEGQKAGAPKTPTPKASAATPADAKASRAFFAPAMRITKRPDVADALKTPGFVDAGYDLLTTFEDVEVGEYAVTIVQVNAAGNVLTCDTRRRVKVE